MSPSKPVAHSARPRRDFRAPHILALFILLTAVISIPVLTHQLPPLSDYVNHLARMHVIETIDNDPYLAKFSNSVADYSQSDHGLHCSYACARDEYLSRRAAFPYFDVCK